ncbi:hypothetical protein FNV62_51105 [Streptomyces sp. RLB3-17]|uniref:hypothetical protein n=1 Tax=unclassified Streptomyces TaxID=2593676 RepID=UPI001162E26D|nr:MULTISPECIES: hypothetical protein [unclassified Streptomyces]QDO03411.1 hypothetical protein FNV58_52730 [Streptomyces sp. RLB1-9]QDO25144.1 hypothetical protein FNV65_51310 [Streptomyces sp. S1A1-8]QDO35264.1 hypothetical protein FNV63_51335 [Streptomyces sp. S1A1-3]QDO45279.1 hypothetical protein FNV62_51105 [Streptomyces sp. RLB3-17]
MLNVSSAKAGVSSALPCSKADQRAAESAPNCGMVVPVARPAAISGSAGAPVKASATRAAIAPA